MLPFTGQKTISAIKRLVYVGDKSSYSSVGSATGYLRPLNEVENSNAGFQYGNGFSLIIETDVDIREADKITIDSVEYTIKGVVNHDRGGITAYKRCLMVKPEKA